MFGATRPLAIGAMRLSTADDRDETRSAAVLDAALAAGVAVIDTADVYARDESELGHNERLIAAALARSSPAGALIVTKSGLRRDGPRWVADGRASHVIDAARATRARLGGGPLALHLLHAPDPQVPFATSVRALAKLVEDGDAVRVGLSNVNRTQLDEALALGVVEVSAVEVELGPHRVDAIRGGLVARCEERGIAVLAYRPFGGVGKVKKLGNDAVVRRIAERCGATAQEVVLAWLRGLSPVVVALPGVGTVGSVQSVVRAAGVELEEGERRELDERWVNVGGGGKPRSFTSPSPSTSTSTGGEVVIVMGMPGAGKSTVARELGHVRFNRDERGGTLEKMAVLLDEALASGVTSAVLDNTYATRALRAPVVEVARRHGLPVRCVWIDTTIEDAQVNAAARILERHGRLPEPGEMNKLMKQDPGAFKPGAQFNWRREFEPPQLDEGFAAVERIEFTRQVRPGTNRALVVDLDDVVRVGRPVRAAEVRLVDGVAEALARWRAAGWLVVGTAWQPAAADLAAVDARTAELLGAAIDIVTCVHPAGPPVCWCRKPMPGLGLVLARRHQLDLGRSLHAGKGAADRGFAGRLGLRFLDAADLAASPPAVD